MFTLWIVNVWLDNDANSSWCETCAGMSIEDFSWCLSPLETMGMFSWFMSYYYPKFSFKGNQSDVLSLSRFMEFKSDLGDVILNPTYSHAVKKVFNYVDELQHELERREQDNLN